MALLSQRETSNLVLSVRQASGVMQPHEALVPLSASDYPQAYSSAVPADVATFGYIADLMVCFAFKEDERDEMALARGHDLLRLQLTPEQALAHAIVNFKRSYSSPVATQLPDTLVWQVHSNAPFALNSNVVFDAVFWSRQRAQHGDLLVALPKRGIVLFIPANQAEAVSQLTQFAQSHYPQLPHQRMSDYLLHCTGAGWNVECRLFPPPLPPSAPAAAQAPFGLALVSDPEPSNTASHATASANHEEIPEPADEWDLDLAGSGQKMVIHSILGNFVLNAMLKSPIPPLVIALFGIGLMAYSLLGILRIGSGLGMSKEAKIWRMVHTGIPLVNIVSLIQLSMRTTKELREAGYEVGLLGVK
ncbi:MAG: hypothetical protein Q4G39_00430 [Brachymonas sp.]|nr:hypothetical protein [Brachymonas sp.]